MIALDEARLQATAAQQVQALVLSNTARDDQDPDGWDYDEWDTCRGRTTPCCNRGGMSEAGGEEEEEEEEEEEGGAC